MRSDLPPPLVGVLMLPSGMNSGFIAVTLGYVLSHHGVGVDVIAGLVGLRLLPDTWSFLAGPMIDACLTLVSWYSVAIVTLSLCAVGFALAPLEAADTSLLGALCLASGIAANLASATVNGVLALTTTKAVRGACAGWRQTGYLGGLGLGGGAGLWLASHAGGLRVSALALAAVSLACTLLIGAVQVRYGSMVMLLVEASLGVVSVAGYAALVSTLRPERARPPGAESLA